MDLLLDARGLLVWTWIDLCVMYELFVQQCSGDVGLLDGIAIVVFTGGFSCK